MFQRQHAAGEPLTVVGDGLQTRDFTHVSDVVEANMKAAFCDNNKALGETFNIGTGVNFSVMDIVKMVDKEEFYINLPQRLGEARDTKADNSKAKDVLGWEPKVKLEEWINESTSTVSNASES